MTTAVENAELVAVEPGTLMGDLFRCYWVPALMSSELPFSGCAPVRVRLLGEDLLAFRTGDGEIGLTDELCAHRRASLFYGRVEECGVRCTYHGWAYAPDGSCYDTPNDPRPRFKEGVHLKSYPCREIGGLIWTYMGAPERMPEAPEFEFAMVPDDHRYMTKRLQESNWLQAVEGNLDGSHVKYLHSDLHFWYPIIPGAAPGTTSVTVAANTSSFQAQSADYGLLTGACRSYENGESNWRFNHIALPCFQLVAPDAQFDPNQPCHVMVPIDNERTWVFSIDYNPVRPITNAERKYYDVGGGIQPELIPGTPIAIRNRDNDYLIDRDLQRSSPMMTGIKAVGIQDAVMQESMGPIVRREEEHLCVTDVAVVAFRRLLLDVAHAYRESGTPPLGLDPATHHVRSRSIIVSEKLEDWVAASRDYTQAQGPHYADSAAPAALS